MKSNNQMGIVRTARWALGAAVLLCVGLAQAQGLELTNEVFQEVQVTNPDGTVETRTAPVRTVVPGTRVIYVINYRNAGDALAENVTITNPVPVALVYEGVEGPIPVTEVSVDGGSEYGNLADLTVPGPDGEPRPASETDVTHLRWIVPRLAAGAEGTVSFAARVK